jgi:3-phenylpropionate/trans-cinnamate dioxygenase ferredoxin component
LKLVGRVAREALVGVDFVKLDYPPWNVLVALVDGAPFAIEDSCNHAGASLCEGPREGDTVICPMHGYIFSLRTGALLAPLRLCDAQRTFATTVEGDDVLVWDNFHVQIVIPPG